MNHKILFASINSFLGYPPIKQIFLHLKSENDIYYIQSDIREFENFFDIPFVNKKTIFFYPNSKLYNSQSRSQKIFKYIFLIFYYLTFKFKFKKEAITIVTIDLFTLLLSLLIKGGKSKIIYIQYEVMELPRLNRLDKLLFRLIKKRSKKIDIIITPEENRTNILKDLLPNSKHETFFTIPNSNNNILNIQSRDNDKIIITHVGAVGLNHNIRSFLNSIAALDNRKYEIRFIGTIKPEVLDLIKKFNYFNVKIFGQIKHNELEKYYLETDIGIILYRDDGINYRFCAPNKLYEYWSYGIPVLGDILPGLQSVFKECCLGELVDMSYSSNISNSILKLSKPQYKNGIRSYFDRHYKLDIFLSDLNKKLKN
jgi:hypothetical protein